MRIASIIAAGALGLGASVALANEVDVEGGQTNVALDTELLLSAAGLEITGISPEVIAPGDLPDSVAFPINPRDASAPLLPTTFTYTAPDLAPFSGAIEHEGKITFNDAVTVGNFTIGFDGARVGTLGGLASGFFVASTAGTEAVLFDLELTGATTGAAFLEVSANLLVSPEFAGLLNELGLTMDDLSGADVGDALVDGQTGCSAVDINDNGRVNFGDYIRFLRQFKRDRDAADFDGSGDLDRADLIGFLTRFVDCLERERLIKRIYKRHGDDMGEDDRDDDRRDDRRGGDDGERDRDEDDDDDDD